MVHDGPGGDAVAQAAGIVRGWAHRVPRRPDSHAADGGAERSVLVPWRHRPRHHPRAPFAWREEDAALELVAVRDLPEGTEVTVRYSSGGAPPTSSEHAAAAFGFDVSHTACVDW